MADSAPRIGVVVVNYGSHDLVAHNLGRLADEAPHLDIIVVDSFSSSEERAAVSALCHDRGWTALLLDENAGFGGGVNRGASAAFERGADVLFVINPDAVIGAGDVASLAAHSAGDDGCLVAPVIRRPDGSLWSEGTDLYLDDGTMAGVRHRSAHGERARMFWVSGACFALSRALWMRIGGFDESYFLYWEDVDLTRRILDLGGEVRIVRDASAVHDEGGTHGGRADRRAKSETYYYYNIRNRLLFARRNLTESDVRRWRRSALAVSFGILLQGGRRQLVTSIEPWRALVIGLRDGRRGKTGAR
ncbi:glycosyltransferase family 2 protein [Microbacterium sp.]|uniref:glycosyltransferase family 2 protein n=1 Tax=Microbacterium sp. TaxID=51671 RepID=UPI003F72F8ED